MLRLEAVSVCINYPDFLQVTAAENRGLFDRWIVVTTPEDTLTREVCRRFGMETLLTEEATRDGSFSKGRLVDRALYHLSSNAWRLHVDADIVLPSNFHALLKAAHVDENAIHGFDRFLCRSWADWQSVKASSYMQNQLDYHCRVHYPVGLEMGTRWAHPEHGWCPIGWAQLWHARADEWRGVRVKNYPVAHGEAARTDTQFSMSWDRRRRVFIPEVVALHLESEPAPRGANWLGRATRWFGAPGSEPLGWSERLRTKNAPYASKTVKSGPS